MLNLIRSYSEIQELLAQIRNIRKGFITNFYPDPFKTELWIQKNEFYYDRELECILFFHKTLSYTTLYFCTTSLESLDRSLRCLQKGAVYVVDVITKNANAPVFETLFNNGFAEHTVLTRMFKSNSLAEEEISHDEHIRTAKSNELSAIQSLIELHFDEYSEQSPEKEELEQSILQSRLKVYVIDSQIAGFILFDMIGVTLHLRFWFVGQNYRDKKVGSALLNHFFKCGKDAKRLLLWVMKSNENAIKRYRHYGFENEEMYDYVMVNNEGHERTNCGHSY